MKQWIINNKKTILDSIFMTLSICLIISLGIISANRIIEYKLTKEVLKEYQNNNNYEIYLHYGSCRYYTYSQAGIEYVVNDDGTIMYNQDCLLTKEGVEE